MKGAVILLLCAVALAQGFHQNLDPESRKCNCDPSEAEQICEANYDDDNVLIAHENCDQFYKCTNGKPVAYYCPDNLLYDPHTELCDWSYNVECGDRPISEGQDSGNDTDTDTDNDSSDDDDTDNEGTCNCNPGEAPSICAAEDSNGIFVANQNCNQFYKCAEGLPVTFDCPPTLLYDPYREVCDWPQNVECGDRVIPEPDDEEDDSGSSNEEDSENDGTCNCNPEEAPAICAAPDSDSVLVAHEHCDKYYICSHGIPVVVSCAENLLFDPYTKRCDWPRNVDCGDRLVPDTDCVGCDDDDASDCDESDEALPPGDSNGSESADIDDVPPPGDDDSESADIDAGPPQGDDDSESADIDAGPPQGDDDSESADIGDGNGSCNCNPEEAPSICAGENSDGILVAHENCNQFYKCDSGKPVALLCPGNLLYNPYTEKCDWPENVDCGDRVIPEPDNDDDNNDSGDNDGGGSDGGGNCDPSEAPTICAADGSDGVLVAHENCNQFYKCSEGKPVALLCPGNLLFDPNTDRCDWPENVDCGDRVIPEPDNDNDNNDSGDNDGGGSDGGGNCDPSEAPTICAADGSDGVLVAHENCNQFYKCSEGKPVALLCPGNLLFDPNTDRCDWPENVDCGDRVIPEPDNDNDNNDSGDNDGGGSDGGGNEGGGNCDPSEAPTICAADGSDGVLVAHENCNQFYKCSEGKPVALSCPGNLLFNPNTDQCDWPENVDCGDRVIPDKENDDSNNNSDDNDGGGSDGGGSDGGDNDGCANEDCDNNSSINDSGENDGGGGDGGDSDGGANEGGGNCDPSEAPTICSADDSDSVLVAHENCNQFYICSGGKPVVLSCPGNLLFNPNTDQCDWPENVDCGDRVIPDKENDDSNNNSGDNDGGGSDGGGSDGGDNDGGDNDGGANEDSDNNSSDIDDLPPPGDDDFDSDNDNNPGDNNSSNNSDDSDCECNCDPDQATSICAGVDSDGVQIAHENCNQFYTCDNGQAVPFKCPSNLLYNPYTAECDWPSNVECGDRVIPDPEDDDNNTSESEEVEDDDNVGPCNCDPGEAPAICAVDGSSGVQIAHEYCNQFYICDHGRPVAVTCKGFLLYNPYTQRCDWPANVECGDRVIPELGEDSDDDNDDDVDDCSSNEVNDDPSEAPTICAANDSEGVLVAHENCDQYYICTGGVPVSRPCTGGLLFNPIKQYCDWAQNVDCGDRIVPDDDDCVCNPRNAPALCARPDSEGTLIAHENCNQFYMCAHAVPVAHTCPAGLHYSLDTERCDWPMNVKCENRLLSYISLNKHRQSRQTLRQ